MHFTDEELRIAHVTEKWILKISDYITLDLLRLI